MVSDVNMHPYIPGTAHTSHAFQSYAATGRARAVVIPLCMTGTEAICVGPGFDEDTESSSDGARLSHGRGRNRRVGTLWG